MEKVTLTLILLVALAGLCTLIGALILLETQRVKRDLSSGTPPGRRVALAGRNLHLRCKGMGHPLVIIEQGAGEPSRFWWPLQDQIATFTRVCTYDRAGYGWSDPAPGDRTVADRAAELRALLAAADLSGPCILVAHSYGGLIVRAFARSYPELTAGLVLVDTAEEETLRQPEVLTMYRRFRVMLRLFEGLARLGLVRFLGTLVDLERFGMPGTRAMEFAAAADDLASIERGSAAERTSSPPGCLCAARRGHHTRRGLSWALRGSRERLEGGTGAPARPVVKCTCVARRGQQPHDPPRPARNRARGDPLGLGAKPRSARRPGPRPRMSPLTETRRGKPLA